MASYVNAAFMGIIGLAGLYATRNLFARQKTIAAWPKVYGKLLSKEAATSPFGSSRYYLAVRYTYEVNGTTHESTQYSPLVVYARTKRVIEQDLETIPETVGVYYNPEKPDEAYLSLGPTFWPKVAQVCCGIMVVIAGVMFLS